MLDLLALIKSLPVIFSTMLELKAMFDQYLDSEKRAEAMKLLGDSISEARTTKDTTKLTALVNNILSGNSFK